MDTSPLTVLITAYNAEPYLRAALDSVLAQQGCHFQVLIVEDCSTDDTPAILAAYDDPRLRVVHNPTNLGQNESLNKGLSLIETEFIARMDADDIALPGRFERQLAFLRQHPDYAVVGCQSTIIDEHGTIVRHARMPMTWAEAIYWLVFERAVVPHPGATMRRSAVEEVGRYDDIFAQDYQLWGKLMTAGYRITNLPDTLLHYRLHSNQKTALTNERKWNTSGILSDVLAQHLPEEQVEPIILWSDYLYWGLRDEWADAPPATPLDDVLQTVAGLFDLAADALTPMLVNLLLNAAGTAADQGHQHRARQLYRQAVRQLTCKTLGYRRVLPKLLYTPWKLIKP